MQHRNAPLTPNGRRRLVALVEEQRLTFEAAAAASNVAKSTCWEWVRRWREATEAERRSLSCLTDRFSRPERSPAQVPEERRG
jgi:transposase-like protein